VSELERDRNPYESPRAELADPTSQPPRRIGWKVYLWVMVLLLATVPILGVQWIQPLDLVDLGISIAGTAGLFGYAYRRHIGSRSFWRAWLPIEVVWDLAIVLFLAPIGMAQQYPNAEPSTFLEDAIGILVLTPLYLALYFYAFRSPELWQRSLRGEGTLL